MSYATPTEVTQIPGGRDSGPQNLGWAASLRSESPNRDVYVKVPSSPKLHSSRVVAGREKKLRSSHHHRHQSPPGTDLVRYDPPPPSDDWYHSPTSSPSRDPEVDLASTQSNSRATLLARRRQLRGGGGGSSSSEAAEDPHQASHQALHPAFNSQPHPLTVDALEKAQQTQQHHHHHHQQQHHHHHQQQQQQHHQQHHHQQQQQQHNAFTTSQAPRSRYAGSSAPGSPRRAPSAAPSSAVAFNTAVQRDEHTSRTYAETASSSSKRSNKRNGGGINGSGGGGSARDQTRIFRMSGMTPRELVIENLRLQDHMTELQNQQHETMVASREISASMGGAGSIVGSSGGDLGVSRRAERSVNVLATTNADLSRRVQSAVVGEANAMASLQRMEEEAREQGKRFAELVEIARGEEAAREEAEKVSNECQQKMKETENRVVRLLSRLHAETQNTTRLKKLLGEANAKLSEVGSDVHAGDAALSRAYEQTQAECQELRRQVGVLRRENTMLVETVRDDAQERYAE